MYRAVSTISVGDCPPNQGVGVSPMDDCDNDTKRASRKARKRERKQLRGAYKKARKARMQAKEQARKAAREVAERKVRAAGPTHVMSLNWTGGPPPRL